MKDMKYALAVIILGILFWMLQFVYQYSSLAGDSLTVVVRSAAFTTATLIGIALIVGPLAQLFPRFNYIRHRRAFGVLGFTFTIVHVTTVLLYYGFGLLTNANPYSNPLIFGLLAFILYIPLYATSTGWAMRKLTYGRWKAIHRLVYLAFILTVLHYAMTNPAVLLSVPGYILMLVTIFVFGSELAAFSRHRKTSRAKAFAAFLISLAAVLFYFSGSQVLLYISIGSLIVFVLMLAASRKPKQETGE